MALIDKKILNPIRHHQDNANTVIGQASTMKALFDQGAEDLRVKLNGVIDELLATTGAQQIGIDPARGLGNTLADALTNIKNYMNLGASGISATTIGTGSGNTVQSQLEWLLLQIQNVLLNQIPDGTITMQKLATTLANTINGNTSNIGDLTALTTTEKTNLVGAVNELVSQSAQIQPHLSKQVTDAGGVHGFKIENGTFTPRAIGLGGGEALYSSQSGKYQLMGNRVFYDLEVVISSKNNIVGDVSIAGLPFVLSSTPTQTREVSAYSGIILPSGRYQVGALGIAGTPLLFLLASGNQDKKVLNVAEITNSFEIRISGSYLI